MIKASAAILVVLVPAHGCKLDNIDRAEPTYVKVPSMEICEGMAGPTDSALSVRAFCIPLGEPHDD